MKRPVFAALAGLVLGGVTVLAPAADAVGAGVCMISGTIRFTPTVADPSSGTWAIAPAVIQCRGLRGTFQIPQFEGNCLAEAATTALFLAEVTMVRTGGLA